MAAPNLWAVLCESKRIINAHSSHFLALSVIFLLPLSFSLIVCPTLFHLFSPSSTNHIQILLRIAPHHHHQPPTPLIDINVSTLIFPLAFSLFLLLTYLCVLSSITHSVLHGFFGRPVKLPSALLSTLSSFLPLLTTQFLSYLLLLLPTIPIILFSPLSQTLSSSPLYLFLYALLLIFLLLILIYLRITWTLAPVIAVAESSYAIRPLRRSAALMRGMKPLGASVLLFFGLLEGLLLYSSSVLVTGSDGSSAWWKDWAFVAQIVMTSTTLMIMLLYNTTANTVLYMYCKAVHGELAVEIVEEFAREYVSLPFDEGKVPHVVSVVPHHV